MCSKHLSVDFVLPNICSSYYIMHNVISLMLQIVEKLTKNSHIYLVYNSLVFNCKFFASWKLNRENILTNPIIVWALSWSFHLCLNLKLPSAPLSVEYNCVCQFYHLLPLLCITYCPQTMVNFCCKFDVIKGQVLGHTVNMSYNYLSSETICWNAWQIFKFLQLTGSKPLTQQRHVFFLLM